MAVNMQNLQAKAKEVGKDFFGLQDPMQDHFKFIELSVAKRAHQCIAEATGEPDSLLAICIHLLLAQATHLSAVGVRHPGV
jgi:hypothetical protein